jgi:pilus assembly protein CpaB
VWFTVKNRIPVVIGLCSIAAGAATWIFLHQLEKTYQETGETVAVLTARRYIPRGSPLRPVYFQSVDIPKPYVQPGALSRFDVLESSPGRPVFRSLAPLLEGTQLVQRDIVPVAQEDALSHKIPPNQVAVSFGVDAVRGFSGNLQPGDLLDVLHGPKENEDHAGRPTALLLQAIPLIAVGQHWRTMETNAEKEKSIFAEPPDDNLTVLTVLVNPVSAVRLIQARESGILSVILRSQGDDRVMENIP